MTLSTNLHLALDLLGISTQPSNFNGKRDWYTSNGELIGSYDAHEGWAKLKTITEAVGHEMGWNGQTARQRVGGTFGS